MNVCPSPYQQDIIRKCEEFASDPEQTRLDLTTSNVKRMGFTTALAYYVSQQTGRFTYISANLIRGEAFIDTICAVLSQQSTPLIRTTYTVETKNLVCVSALEMHSMTDSELGIVIASQVEPDRFSSNVKVIFT